MSSTKILNGKIEKKGRSFNLVDEPWIPVLDANGQERSVGLRELFERAEELVDLATGPLETIALYRLFVCIAQRALNGPANDEDWKQSRNILIRKSIDYLEEWKLRFDLFGERPFLQVRGLELKSKEPSKTDKLDFGLACGESSSTLCDQNAVGKGRVHEPYWLALKLLVFQSFSPGGTIGVAMYCGKETDGNGSSENAPCKEGSMLITLLKGRNINENIWLNLVPLDRLGNLSLGRPVWEYDVYDERNKKEISGSWLGRLVPLARFIELEENGRQMILANGVSYAKLSKNGKNVNKLVREPMGTVVSKSDKKDIEWKYVGTDPEKNPWRDLYSILSMDQENRKGVFTLDNLNYYIESSPNETSTFRIFVGGLKNVEGKNAKIFDSAYWNLEVSISLLGTLSLENYETGVKQANSAEKRLVNAIKIYCDFLKEESQKEGLKSKTSLVSRAKKIFWTLLEQRRSDLEESASNGTLSEWTVIVTNVMKESYEHVCPRLTSRQLQAYIEGRRRLYFDPNKKERKPQTEDKSNTVKSKKTKSKRKQVEAPLLTTQKSAGSLSKVNETNVKRQKSGFLFDMNGGKTDGQAEK